MGLTMEVTGLNLERLMSLAAAEGILVRNVRRTDERRIILQIGAHERLAFEALCERYGWKHRVAAKGFTLRALLSIKRRPSAVCGAALYILLMIISSSMIWHVRIEHAGKDAGEVRSYLQSVRIGPGRRKQSVSVSELRDALLLRLPDLAHVSVYYEGSVLAIDCQPSIEGEEALLPGSGRDIVASRDGIVTGIVVQSGTPVVSVGQAVRAGDVLIRGEERGEKQSLYPVIAQGEVTARVWARGEAKASRKIRRTVETGAMRRRVILCFPWHSRVVSEARPFEKQDESVEIQPVVGLFLPLWRRIETFAEIEIIEEERSVSDAFSMAQGSAEQMAKNKCPAGVHILDKTVENSMIDNEYVYSAVVLEYESSIAVRTVQDP